jgi:hypothetical protein
MRRRVSMDELGPYPEFAWSQSRRRVFQECPRKYYWQYYGHWKGWEADADEQRRLAYRLGKMQSLHIVVGAIVHGFAARTILDVRGGKRQPAPGELLDEGRQELNQAWVDSQKKAAWEASPKWRTMLHEFYYGTGPSQRTVESIREKLSSCIEHFLACESYRAAIAAPFVEVREVDVPMASFDLDGFKVYGQPDLVYRTGDGVYHIVDWKTGREEDLHLDQLRVYALYIRSKWQGGPIEGCLEYLLEGTREVASIDDDAMALQKRDTLDSIAGMQGYLRDRDTNEARSKGDFPLSSDLSVCRYCNFYELDEAEIKEAEPIGPF